MVGTVDGARGWPVTGHSYYMGAVSASFALYTVDDVEPNLPCVPLRVVETAVASWGFTYV